MNGRSMAAVSHGCAAAVEGTGAVFRSNGLAGTETIAVQEEDSETRGTPGVDHMLVSAPHPTTSL